LAEENEKRSTEEEPSEEDTEMPSEPKPKDRLKNLKRDTILFYTGVILVIVGGPGLAFGSWLHDWLSVPIIGYTYSAFGWLNVIFAIAGIIVLIIGIVLLVLSLRGGVVTEQEIKSQAVEG
jgi:hypothetical protein